MGFEVTRFIGEIHEEFYCPICTMILEEPMHSPCDHLFCKDCIKGWLEANESCPTDREQDGCQAVVALEHLQKHIASCEHNPKAERICDKGCNLKITRREYQMNECLIHLSDRVRLQEEEITKLSDVQNSLSGRVQLYEQENKRLCHVLREQKEQFQRVEERLEEQITELKQKFTKFSDGRQQNDVPSKSEVSPQKWRAVENMKIESNILQVKDVFRGEGACAISMDYLKPASPFFKVKILSIGGNGNFSNISIGLKDDKSGEISYRKKGILSFKLFGNVEKIVRNEHSFQVNDVIKCGIDFPQYKVYFSKNDELIEEKALVRNYQYFPYVRMSGVSKIEYLTN